MPAEPYLLELGNRLSAGLSGLDPQRRERHRRFILAQQTADGGFCGRETPEELSDPGDEDAPRESDLYYSAFAVRSLAVMGATTAEDCRPIAGYLKSIDPFGGSVIDIVSWLYCALIVQTTAGIDVLAEHDSDWPVHLAEFLESFRTEDGGYAKTHEGAAGSTYHTFLIALCYELIGRTIPHPERLIQFIYDRQRDDGGFVEIGPMKRSGTNPTAAAVAVLRMYNAFDDEFHEDVRAFLREVRGDEGGFPANTRIPFSDSLSTFTGLLTCQDLGIDNVVKPHTVERFINALEFPDGGFRGAGWDEQADVEYTFYALGVLGLLGTSESPS